MRCSSLSLGILAWLFFGGLGFAQFYHPDDVIHSVPSDYEGLRIQEFFFPSEDGTRLHGWLIMADSRRPKGTIVHYHGNAHNLTLHAPLVAWLAQKGYHVILFDYRGYGRSEGSANRRGLHADSLAALKEAMRRLPQERRFFLYGQSLGAAQALNVAAEIDDPRLIGVVAEGGFDSYRRIAGEKLQESGFAWMPNPISSELDPIDAVGEIGVPLLLIHGVEDRVVPVSHGERLYAAAKEPKTFWRIPRAGHIGTFRDPNHRRRLVEWLDSRK